MMEPIRVMERRVPMLEALLNPRGMLVLEFLRDNKIIGVSRFKNAVTTAGKALLLNTMFGATAKSANWYMGLISNAGYSATNVADTMASHAGWTEFTGYAETTRPQWVTIPASTNSITNTSLVTFNINATGSVIGAFITNDSTKGGTTGTLWASGSHGSATAVANTDQVRETYTLTV